MSPTILITGATGTQGGATIKALLSTHSPPTIHALVRDPNSTASQRLASLSPSVKLFTGHFDSIPSLTAAAANCTAAFINVSPDLTNPSAEIQHCSNILSALSSIPTITHIIYTSVSGTADPTKPDAFASLLPPTSFVYNYYLSKSTNETAVITTAEQQGWNWTILQPAVFLSNFLTPTSSFMYPLLATDEHKVVTAYPPDLKLGYLDTEDIGRFAAAAFTASKGIEAEKFKAKRIPLASVELTLQEVADSVNASLDKWGKGVKMRIEYLSKEDVEARKEMDPFIGMQVVLIENPMVVDLEAVRGFGIELGEMGEFWEREKGRLEESFGV